ncbi:MAG TPA: ribonucleotide reductase N-terminal alpha domain-containing protein, partial [Candidatus Ozemobacteraceae bacterium]|nr:ribonucleotide reductase N-terminal alpha domain-containing protein [Candidatus Ozemobacteraceae bacterium]
MAATTSSSFLTRFSANAQKVLAKRYLTRGPDGQPTETIEQLFRRVAKAIASAEEHFPGSPFKPEQLEPLFFDLMTSLDFLPNSD